MDDIVNRFSLLLKEKNLTASKFADEIGVQRSGISHIMTGRNKPSLDFVLKVLERYPEISADWLLTGQGHYKVSGEADLFSEEGKKEEISREAPERPKSNAGKHSEAVVGFTGAKQIEKIVLFFNDGTYQEFSP